MMHLSFLPALFVDPGFTNFRGRREFSSLLRPHCLPRSRTVDSPFFPSVMGFQSPQSTSCGSTQISRRSSFFFLLRPSSLAVRPVFLFFIHSVTCSFFRR